MSVTLTCFPAAPLYSLTVVRSQFVDVMLIQMGIWTDAQKAAYTVLRIIDYKELIMACTAILRNQ